jgi:fructokinase
MNSKQGVKRRIYAIGETVFDLQMVRGQPVSGRPGGAMLNSAVSLGRLGLDVSLISEISKDYLGELIFGFLKENGVKTQNSYLFKAGKTPLALAFLNEDRDASFMFYKDFPVQRLKIKIPTFRKNDIVLFGSSFSLDKAVRNSLVNLLLRARDSGALIIYDPNFRRPHLDELPSLHKYIDENISLSDIVRGSSNDFEMIFNTHHVADTFRLINERGCENLISTSGDRPAHFKSLRHTFSLHPPSVEPVSTVGAGDSFNAGLIYSLIKLNIGKDDLNSIKKQEWQAIIEMGMAFGASVCETYENYISRDFATRLFL